MKLIVGLGNPGEKYKNTPHNAGFMFLDTLGLVFEFQKKFEAEITVDGNGEKKIVYAKPQTFMNNSGRAVLTLLQFYKLEKENLLIIHDEVDLKLGDSRYASGSSAAGHKGVQNIIDILGTKEFSRIRIGVDGRDSRKEISTEDYVLKKFTEQETEILYNTSFPETKKQLEKFLTN